VLERADRGSSNGSKWDDDPRSAFDVLGVDPEASSAEIRRAYLRCVRTWHPDRFSRNPERQRLADRATKQINAAYESLCRRQGLSSDSTRATTTARAHPVRSTNWTASTASAGWAGLFTSQVAPFLAALFASVLVAIVLIHVMLVYF
jgi:hypothetical protein